MRTKVKPPTVVDLRLKATTLVAVDVKTNDVIKTWPITDHPQQVIDWIDANGVQLTGETLCRFTWLLDDLDE